MLAAIVYRLQAIAGGRLPVSHGRFAHAAALQLIQKYDEKTAAEQHDSGVANEFTASLLQFGNKKPQGTVYYIKQQEACTWRVTALNQRLAEAFIKAELGSTVRVGEITFTLIACICDPDREPSSGFISKDAFIEGIYALPRMKTLTLSFLTPTLFRVNDRDYPFPLPELIFASLARRAAQLLGFSLPIEQLKEQAQGLMIPIQWEGRTKRVYLGDKGGATGFIGSCTFDLRYLDDETERLFLLLSELGAFTGLGRLTGQGLGQLRVEYK